MDDSEANAANSCLGVASIPLLDLTKTSDSLSAFTAYEIKPLNSSSVKRKNAQVIEVQLHWMYAYCTQQPFEHELQIDLIPVKEQIDTTPKTAKVINTVPAGSLVIDRDLSTIHEATSPPVSVRMNIFMSVHCTILLLAACLEFLPPKNSQTLLYLFYQLQFKFQD
ncbi:hypothetical protein Ciccas_005427 [Cichlidogyrus casuarinus]|uniref:Uncharacterized protein n=1 Tax=Cichlidogyrus casuarinus TaxID=1844966 RepID=A0ABD2QCB3_9PLAT